jgi:uncharacterized protein YjbI with pentapeptide repeats
MVYDPRKSDPEIMLSEIESKEYSHKFGHRPTFEQLNKYRAEKARQASIKLAEQTDKEAVKRKIMDEKARERQEQRKRIVSQRLANRNRRPKNYRPPKKLDDLIARNLAGESYFADAEVSFEIDGKSLILDFEGCNFTGATLTDITLNEGSTFENVIAQGATLRQCSFLSESNFANVDLKNATIEETAFEESAIITGTSFEGARFDNKCRIPFDENLVLRANFKSVSSDWVQIYTAFTGVQQFINITFCFGYFFLLIGKIFALGTLAGIQKRILSDPNLGELIANALKLDGGTPVWQLTFGGATPTFLSIVVAGLILIYQIERYRLTNAIAPMIEDQKTDGITPRVENYLSLTKQFKRNFYLGIIALTVFCIDLFFALISVVYTPSPALFNIIS